MDSGIILPIIVFAVFVAGSWWLLTLISSRNSQAEDRLERMGRPKSLAEIDIASRRDTGMSGLKKMMEGMGASIASQQSDLEKNSLRVKLANAGFRSETAPAVFQGLRIAGLVGFLVVGAVVGIITEGLSIETLKRVKDDVKEVKSGFECGIKLAGYDDIKVGDRYEAYIQEKFERTL